MEKQGILPAFLRFMRTVVLIDLGIFVGVGLICWFGGWRTAYHYGNGLMLVGVAAMAAGVFSLAGGWGLTRDFSYQHAASAGVADTPERTRRELKDTGQRYGFLALMGVAGIVSIAFGILIQTAFG